MSKRATIKHCDCNWLWELVDRGPGWDGHDAAAITADVVENVEKFMQMCMDAPDVIPCRNGGIGLEWAKNEDNWVAVVIQSKRYKMTATKDGKLLMKSNNCIDALLDDGDGVFEMIEEVIK